VNGKNQMDVMLLRSSSSSPDEDEPQLSNSTKISENELKGEDEQDMPEIQKNTTLAEDGSLNQENATLAEDGSLNQEFITRLRFFPFPRRIRKEKATASNYTGSRNESEREYLSRKQKKLKTSQSTKKKDKIVSIATAVGKQDEKNAVSGNQKKTQPPIKKRLKKRNLAKRLFQFLSLAAAILIVSPFLSGELASFQQPLIYEHGHSPRSPPVAGPSSPTGSLEEELAPSTPEETDTRAEEELKSRSQTVIPEERSPKRRMDREGNARSTFSSASSSQERRSKALSFVIEAVQKVGPAVVRIDTETHLLQEDEGLPAAARSPGFVQQGQGSGLIFSKDGFIITNAHVIEDATRVTVTLTDGRVYEAEVKGADEIVDIAVLKILPSDDDEKAGLSKLPVAQLGDSDMLNVGQIVVAVGSPGGLDNTVTMGIVSGLERSSTVVGIPHKKVDYIQTDAAINP
jgi:hypothetical protein